MEGSGKGGTWGRGIPVGKPRNCNSVAECPWQVAPRYPMLSTSALPPCSRLAMACSGLHFAFRLQARQLAFT